MVKMLVCYRPPADSEAFEKRYLEQHMPLVKKYPNIKDCSFAKVSRTILGQPPYSHVFTGIWTSLDDFKADMRSEEAAAATEDAKSFASSGFDVFLLEELS